MKDDLIIIAFCCNECAYAAADLAGTMRLSYPSIVRPIRVPCSGLVDILHILTAFEHGADGVLVAGCLKEQCHYVDGNIRAERRVTFLREILTAMGLEEERLAIHFMAASMADEFVRVVERIARDISVLGSSPLKISSERIPRVRNKRELVRHMLKSISAKLKTKPSDLSLTYPISGYGEPILDENKCLGCGACVHVCKSGAFQIDQKGNRMKLNHIYWKCTACESCKHACPQKCLDTHEMFQLSKFLSDEPVTKVDIQMASCSYCGSSFIPSLLISDLEKMLSEKSISNMFIASCPNCRRYARAETIKYLKTGIRKKPVKA
jgi:coenzyme F420-reducing hydrogenase delta subunit/formate hydrogenlyase subunit 6/NADH:ubiquinone oxidoreductase subunit I